jgi:hypothetical protein
MHTHGCSKKASHARCNPVHSKCTMRKCCCCCCQCCCSALLRGMCHKHPCRHSHGAVLSCACLLTGKRRHARCGSRDGCWKVLFCSASMASREVNFMMYDRQQVFQVIRSFMNTRVRMHRCSRTLLLLATPRSLARYQSQTHVLQSAKALGGRSYALCHTVTSASISSSHQGLWLGLYTLLMIHAAQIHLVTSNTRFWMHGLSHQGKMC